MPKTPEPSAGRPMLKVPYLVLQSAREQLISWSAHGPAAGHDQSCAVCALIETLHPARWEPDTRPTPADLTTHLRVRDGAITCNVATCVCDGGVIEVPNLTSPRQIALAAEAHLAERQARQ